MTEKIRAAKKPLIAAAVLTATGATIAFFSRSDRPMAVGTRRWIRDRMPSRHDDTAAAA